MENTFNYITEIIPIFIIVFSIGYGLVERSNVFDLFKEGVIKGMKIIYKIIPVLLGLFVAIKILDNSKIISKIGSIFTKKIIPEEIFSLIFIRCISSSAALANFDLINSKYNGSGEWVLFSAILLGSTETAIYTVMMYSSIFKGKKYKITSLVLFGLLGNFIAILCSFGWIKNFF